MLRTRISLMILFSVSMAFALPQTLVRAQDDSNIQREDDAELIEGLRKRRLFRVASQFCDERLNQTDLDPTSQSRFTIELIKTRTAEAMLSPPESRTALWESINKTVQDFGTNYPGHPRWFMVRVQHALSHIAHGQLLRQELSADMAGPTAKDEALIVLRDARVVLADLEGDIAKAIPDRRGRNLSEHELSTDQLLTLKNNIRYQLAICNLVRAELYDQSEPSDRLNRMDALNRVSENFAEVQRETSIGKPLWWQTKIGQIECARLLGNLNEARQLIETLPKPKTIGVLQSITEQRLRLAIAAGDASYSQSVLQEVQALKDRSPQIDLSLVELGVELSMRSRDDKQNKQWLDFSTSMTRQVEIQHGEYWGRRAELVLITIAGDNSIGDTNPETSNPLKMTTNDTGNGSPTVSNGQLDLLIRLGDQAARKDRIDDALKAYDQASRLAVSQGNRQEALRLKVKSSQLHEKQKRHDLAADTLIRSAKEFAKLDLAAPAHLRGCWNFAQTFPAGNSNAATEAKRTFRNHLLDHLSTWPDAATNDQVYLWLAGQAEVERDWAAAFENYLSLSSEKVVESFDAINRCATNALLTVRLRNESTKDAGKRILNQLGTKAEALVAANVDANAILLTRTELDLRFVSHFPDPSLEQGLMTIAMKSDALRNKAKILNAISISPRNLTKAKQLVADIGKDLTSLEIGEQCLEESIRAQASSSKFVQPLNELRLGIIEQAIGSLNQSDTKGRLGWQIKQSDVLVALNEHTKALAVLKDLERATPNSATIQMQLARTMSVIYEEKDPSKPLLKWRKVAGRLKSHSANWYEAKYNVAKLLIMSGQKDEANKLLRYIQAIPPGWSQSTLASEFERLLKNSK